MNKEEKDIERQEFARRVGKNGDRILMEYFDDIGLANKTNNEINDLINRLRICGVDIKKVFSNPSCKFLTLYIFFFIIHKLQGNDEE